MLCKALKTGTPMTITQSLVTSHPSSRLAVRTDNRFDLLLREESDISQIARDLLGWRVAHYTGRRLEGGDAPSAKFWRLWAGCLQLLSFFASKHWQ